MCTLNNIVLETAPCERPIFDCLYFASASSNHTLTPLCQKPTKPAEYASSHSVHTELTH